MKNNLKKLRNCEQSQCGFMIKGTGCRACQECNTRPYVVHDDCIRCWNCEHDAGILRWDNDAATLLEEVQAEMKMEKLKPKIR